MMPQLRLAVEAKAHVAGLHYRHKPLLVQTSIGNNEGLVVGYVIFKASKSHKACPYMIGGEIEAERPVLCMIGDVYRYCENHEKFNIIYFTIPKLRKVSP